MAHVNQVDFRGRPAAVRWRGMLAAFSLLLAGATQAAAPDLTKAEELLQAGQPAEAAVLFEQALEADPSSVGAHLGLGRAYYALGEYARAQIEFETVLQYDNLPRDLHGQTEVYDQAAEDYAAGREWRPFYYAETGIGNYRENTSSSTAIFGGAGDHDTFLPIRVGGGWNKSMTERHSFNGTLDYRFRAYDESGRRNDSDLRWNFNISRPVDDDNLRFGMRGRVSYRGDGQYRNDWGVFADYRVRLGENDQVTIGGEVRERRYPSGPLRSRTRDIAELTGSWTHSLANGRTSLSLGGQLTQEWATQDRPEGDGYVLGRQRRDRPFVPRLARRRSSGGRTSMSRTTTSARTSPRIPTCSRSATTTCGISAAAWSGASRPAGRCGPRSNTTGKTAASTRWPTARPSSG